jgi:NAD(P)-dependent dehydrogenase (short-subunit alcohol dehydrogenase family)
MRLRDKVVIVTGAAGELGRTFLVALAKEEAKTMVTVAPPDEVTMAMAMPYRP